MLKDKCFEGVKKVIAGETSSAQGQSAETPFFVTDPLDTEGKKKELLDIFDRTILKRDERLKESIRELWFGLDKAGKKRKIRSPLPF